MGIVGSARYLSIDIYGLPVSHSRYLRVISRALYFLVLLPDRIYTLLPSSTLTPRAPLSSPQFT